MTTRRAAVIVPSVLAADFTRLGAQVEECLAAGARSVQVDVMDGQFVPNISVGLPVVEALRARTQAFLDVHLMIADPGRYVDAFIAAGAHRVTVHQEAATHLHRVVHRIKEQGAEAGVALNPATPESTLTEILPDLDVVLVMTVNPGFGGQAFIPRTMGKVRRLRAALDEVAPEARVQVDGGIDESSAGVAAAAGADELVAGSAVFGAADGITAAIARLARAARAAHED